jgi:hypothetical protein
MRTKKYWQNLSEQHYKNLQESRNLNDLKDQALKFLLESPETYRVKLTADVQVINTAPYSKQITKFEYVDGKGKYHSHYRSVDINDLEIISTNAETAVLKFKLTAGRYSFWILNKADETIAEIPEDYFCNNHRGNFKTCEIKACEIKEEANG